MPRLRPHPLPAAGPDPRLERGLRRLVLLGAALVVLLPAARGHHAWFGWLPLWLLAMPLSAWWALHRFRLPQRAAAAAAPHRRRAGRAQARRRGLPRPVPGLRAA